MTQALTFRRRTSALRVLIATALILGSAGWDAAQPAPVVAPHEARPASRQIVKVVAASATEHEQAQWALSRFRAFDLHMPAGLTVQFGRADGCEGDNGRYSQASRHAWICNTGRGLISVEHTILHELAHAWSFEYLAEADIESFLAHRDLASWRDAEAWADKGQEMAAEIVSWGLMADRPFAGPFTRWTECDELAEAFTLLTGQQPTNPTAHCLVDGVVSRA